MTEIEDYRDKISDKLDVSIEEMSHIPEILRKLRTNEIKNRWGQKFKQTEISVLCGVQPTNYYKYEKPLDENGIVPKLEVLVTLSVFYGKSLDFIICGEKNTSSVKKVTQDELTAFTVLTESINTFKETNDTLRRQLEFVMRKNNKLELALAEHNLDVP